MQVLDGGDDETDLAGADAVHLLGAGHELSKISNLVLPAVAHQLDLLALGQFPINDPHVNDHAAVVIVDAVEDEGA